MKYLKRAMKMAGDFYSASPYNLFVYDYKKMKNARQKVSKVAIFEKFLAFFESEYNNIQLSPNQWCVLIGEYLKKNFHLGIQRFPELEKGELKNRKLFLSFVLAEDALTILKTDRSLYSEIRPEQLSLLITRTIGNMDRVDTVLKKVDRTPCYDLNYIGRDFRIFFPYFLESFITENSIAFENQKLGYDEFSRRLFERLKNFKILKEDVMQLLPLYLSSVSEITGNRKALEHLVKGDFLYSTNGNFSPETINGFVNFSIVTKEIRKFLPDLENRNMKEIKENIIRNIINRKEQGKIVLSALNKKKEEKLLMKLY